MFNKYYGTLDPVSGYKQDEYDISVLVPMAATNLIINPSFETNTTSWAAHGASAIARSGTASAFGAYSLAVTPTAAVTDGAIYSAGFTTVTGSTYFASAWFKGVPGLQYEILIMDTTAATVLGRSQFRARGYWQRVWCQYSESGGTTRKIVIRKVNSTSVGVFYIDGVQVETTQLTTYLDGDQVGFLQNENAYYWTGLPHASTSVRTVNTASGGYAVNLRQYGFTLTAIMGLGLGAITNTALPLGLQGGSVYQRSVPAAERSFDIVGQVHGENNARLMRNLDGLETLLSMNTRVNPQQPLALEIAPNPDCPPTVSIETAMDPVRIPCIYVSGLEGAADNYNQVNTSLRFTMYLPYMMGHTQVGGNLSLSQILNNPERRETLEWADFSGGATANAYIRYSPYDKKLYFISSTTVRTWDGTTVAALGAGPSFSPGRFAFGTDGSLYVITDAGTKIDKWNGAAWSTIGTLTVGTTTTGIAVDPTTGYVYVGTTAAATLSAVSITNGLAMWNGTVWASVSSTTVQVPYSIFFAPNGDLYIGNSTAEIARRRSGSWTRLSSVGSASNYVDALLYANGILYAGGRFTTMNGLALPYLARWDGVTWKAVSNTTTGLSLARIYDINVDYDNNVHCVGSLTFAPPGYSSQYYMYWIIVTPAGVTMPSEADARVALNYVTSIALDPTSRRRIAMTTSSAGPYVPASTSITNTGTVPVSPVLKFTGPGSLISIRNNTTQTTIRFNLNLVDGETATLRLDPGNITFISNVRGSILNTIWTGSDLSGFKLAPGVNSIAVLYTGATTANTTATITAVNAYDSLQSAVR